MKKNEDEMFIKIWCRTKTIVLGDDFNQMLQFYDKRQDVIETWMIDVYHEIISSILGNYIKYIFLFLDW